jgi:predicted Na+-dependent transporter
VLSRLVRSVLTNYRELAIVLLAAVLGLTVQGPLDWLVRHQGINILLALLVFATAIAIEPRSLGQLPSLWRPLLLALVVGVTLLPALSWLAARLVHTGPLRDGVMTVGLAPCEIASIATTAIAGGSVVLAGGLLIGSTILTVALAGPILALEVSHASVHPGHIVSNLLLVVALPLVVALLIRFRFSLPTKLEPVAATASTLSVAALVALIAAEVHLNSSYVAVVGALVAFLVATIGLGLLASRHPRSATGSALLLTLSMRDFAIAAGLSAAAFGAKAAAPLGLYGILVLTWGTGCAGYLRRSTP